LGVLSVAEPREVDPDPLTINLDDFLAFVGEMTQLRNDLDQCFPGRLSLTYTQLITDWIGAMRQIGEYLDLPISQLQPTTFQQERRSLREAIRNYEQVEECAVRHGWMSWLDEEVDTAQFFGTCEA